MACLGGTRDEPKPWIHYMRSGMGDEATVDVVRVEGRICVGNPKRYNNPHTSRRGCAECPAFRGLRWDGKVANGLNVLDDPIGLTLEEAGRYDAAVEALNYDDDFLPLATFLARQERELIEHADGTHTIVVGIGERGLRRIGDPEALDRWAERMRAWRAAHPGADKRKRKRDRAAYMRQYRASKRNPVSTAITTGSIGKESDEVGNV